MSECACIAAADYSILVLDAMVTAFLHDACTPLLVPFRLPHGSGIASIRGSCRRRPRSRNLDLNAAGIERRDVVQTIVAEDATHADQVM
eukprot:s11294_g2.t1